MKFADKLSLLMRAHGISNRGLAERLGISHPPIGEWVKGNSLPRPAVAKQLADYFHVTVEDLLDDRRPLPSEEPTAPPPPGRERVPRPPISFFSESQISELTMAGMKGMAQLPLSPKVPGQPPPDLNVPAQLMATLKILHDQLAAQSKQINAQTHQIAELVAYIKSHGLHPPNPKSKGKG